MNIDLAALFVPTTPPLEIFIRGTVTYLALFAMLRATRRRHAGAFGITDLLVLVLIADAAQNAMAGEYTAITDGLLLVAVIVGWALALDWLGYHYKPIQNLVHPPPLPLVENGQLLRQNMRSELVTLDELMTHVRAAGLEDVGQVKRAFVEGNGEVTIIPMDGSDSQPKKKSQAMAGV